jgi:TonB family protein
MNNTTELWKMWEGQWVGGRFPLRVWLDSSDHSAVFLTEVPGQKSQKAALKLIRAEAQDADRQLAQWRRAGAISHPHLLRIFAIGRAQIDAMHFCYLVMEYADEDLSQILPQRPLTATEAGELLPPILQVLSHLHENGLVHGHLRPSNIFAVNNKLKLSSDGIAAAGEPAAKGQSPTAYDAPELTSAPLSPATDVWSLGVTLLEVLTQHAPVFQAIQSSDPDVPETIPQPFRSIVSLCLRREPGQRSTVVDLDNELQSIAATVSAVSQAPAPTKRVNWRILVPLAGTLILIALLAKPFGRMIHPAKTDVQVEDSRPSQKTPPTPASNADANVTSERPSAAMGAVARQVLPDVSHNARNTIQGKIHVTVRVEVSSSGKVSSAVLTSPGPSKYFANRTLQAAQRWEFTPPQLDGRVVSSTWLLRFRIGRASTEVSPVRVDH